MKSNKKIIDLFHRQKKYVKFGDFLDNLDKFDYTEEELAPCFSCEKNGLPNCGNAHCVTRQNNK